jgi:uncharacterized protein YhaN
MQNSKLTKLKQYVVELVNKKRRTVDPNFKKRMEYVNHLQLKVNDMHKAVLLFLQTTTGKRSSNFRNFARHWATWCDPESLLRRQCLRRADVPARVLTVNEQRPAH